MALDIEKLRQKLQETQKRSGNSTPQNNNNNSIKWFKIQDGRNVVRLLPPLDGEEFYVEVKVHYNVGKDGRKQVVCPHEQKGEACPICNHIKELENGTEDDKKQAKRMKPKLKYYYRVLVDNEIQVMSSGVTVFEGILGIICDPDFGDITHPQTGRELIITRKGQGLNTEYQVNARPVYSVLEKDYSQEYPDISVFGNPRSFEDIETLLETGEFPAFVPNNNHTDKDAPPIRKQETYQAPPKKEEPPKLNIEDLDMPKEDPLPDFGENDVEDSIEAEIQRILNRHS